MKIVVTGAFSYTGKYITRRLLDKGEEVITLTNHPDRPDPFGGKVKALPLDFSQENHLAESLAGADVLVNTYWVRFDRGTVTQAGAVENTRTLVRAAKAAGVRRIVHVSITNPSADSHLPYFSGKAANEQSVLDSGISYSILRPTLIFGKEDILINNIAWILRRFPFFAQIGDGRYKLQPVYVDDLAQIACQAVYCRENAILDVTGPETYSFDEMVRMIARKVGHPRPILHFPSSFALQAARFISLFIGDVLITKEEVVGLMAGLLVSPEPPRGSTRLSDWLEDNRETVGKKYASEIARHYK
jgi:nucleoside-diphosphate-sugar epimerase